MGFKSPKKASKPKQKYYQNNRYFDYDFDVLKGWLILGLCTRFLLA